MSSSGDADKGPEGNLPSSSPLVVTVQGGVVGRTPRCMRKMSEHSYVTHQLNKSWDPEYFAKLGEIIEEGRQGQGQVHERKISGSPGFFGGGLLGGAGGDNDELELTEKELFDLFPTLSCSGALARHQEATSPGDELSPEQGGRRAEEEVQCTQTRGRDAKGDEVKLFITYAEFEDMCLNQLHIDLEPFELRRIFANVDEKGIGKMSRKQFVKAIRNRAFFRNILTLKRQLVSGFQMPEDYDFSKSTQENYADMSTPMQFYGPYAKIRATLDYNYHQNYTKERQKWQDKFITSVSVRAEPQQRPWLVYTCGPMGAGKGYALRWMSKHGYFPLENIVHIDPDYFKRMMPEWKGYLSATNSEAGSMCHRESGYLQEIAQTVSMEKCQNVWVDGSLRDGVWFSGVFERTRLQFPDYSIAIFYVHASEDAVRARIKKRASETGRVIPEHLIMQSLRDPSVSLNILTPKTDFIARIDNSGVVPVLESFEVIDHSHNWQVVERKFARSHQSPNLFPLYLAPLTFMNLPVGGLQLQLSETELKKTTYRDNHESIEASLIFKFRAPIPDSPLQRLYDKLADVFARSPFYLSPAYPVTLDVDSRDDAGVPQDSDSFVWCYPHKMSSSELQSITPTDAKVRKEKEKDTIFLSSLNLLTRGAFMYFDLDMNLVAVNVLSKKSTKNMIQFGNVGYFPADVIAALDPRRWSRTTLPAITRNGARFYAWILPGEKIGDFRFPRNQHGCFLYIFHKPSEPPAEDAEHADCYFPVVMA